ncbi:uncharacterized protein LOC122511116 [Leptopilina heterotoma]|uniref:uncharacterized protein LOC122511116 n=1 Tax=Leptopilina heterotoma TaxID=63436 RepID=UPI001CA8F3EA|nr:uncharacterized protein LOC122511116 [Leptopilina heterotoma]
MARQAIGKDLPTFKGSTADWILFERIFYQTTEACGFSSAENMLRLQKCLQGDALDAVRALIMTTNVERVIDVLRRRFGRADHIIEDLMNKATNTASVKEDKPLTMIRFAENVTNLVATVESLDQPAYLSNPILIRQLVNKLPATIKMNWGKRAAKDHSGTNLLSFASWISEEAEAASAIYQPLPPEKEKSEKRVLSCREENIDEKKRKCHFCNKTSHQTSAHSIKLCKQPTCDKPGCTRRHHPTLHNDFLERQAEKSAEKTEPDTENDAERVNCTRKNAKRVYLRILPVTLKGPDREIDTYALLDGGATVSLISDDIANQLGLKGPKRPLITSWYDDSTNEDRESRQVSLEIRGTTGKTYTIKNARTTKMKMPGQSMTVDVEKWPYLKDVDIHDLDNATPTIMIGEDNLHVKKVIQQITGKVGTPFATLTPLGWMVHGPDNNERVDKDFAFLIRQKGNDEEINEQIREFWTTESFGVSPVKKSLSSVEEQRAKEIIDKTLRRVNDRWEVGLLWKTDQEVLPESRENALRRLLSIERKMARDPIFKEKYSENMQAYIKKGYARKLTDDEARNETDRTWYLPHFAAYNPQKPKKLRMVLDAAAKSYGLSLNDRLLKGADLLSSLPGLLFKFREKRIAICGDLREMFHQVRIRKEDCGSQRLLWRDEKTKEICTLEMVVMIFGAISSPYVALEVKNRNAEQFKEMYPEACEAIIDNHYVDDFLISVDTEEEATRMLDEVILVHRKGGFEMHNIMTSSSEVRAAIDPSILAPTGKGVTLTDENNTRILGVHWSPETDSFHFCTQFPKLDKQLTTEVKSPTKRKILQVVMSVYDPFGFLSPLTIRAKILLQEIWKEGTHWDEEVSPEISKIWNDWLKDLKKIDEIKIPRYYVGGIGKLKNVQLHIFCDASTQAFAAATYLRLEGDHGIHITLVTSKSRVAPIKILTVPRLELQSAVMAARLSTFIRQEHKTQLDRVVFWSDSQTVLGWIRSDARKYQPFVAHRIAEILDVTSTNEWRWIPTEQNIADDATRSKNQEPLKQTSRWFQGPSFLKLEETEWPVQKMPDRQSDEIKKEMRKEFCFTTQVEQCLLDCSKYSSIQKITRVCAWILRFIERCRKKKTTGNSWELTGSEIQRAEEQVLRQSQKESFPNEWNLLQTKREVPPSSKIVSLSPVFKDGLIRMNGRVSKDGSGFQPIILDGRNHIVRLLILQHHRKAGHHGRERVVNDLRQNYWITSIRTAVRRSWNDCLLCKHRRAKPVAPMMAPLPTPRLQDNVVAFTDTGVDYFGPMQVTIGRRHEKRYGVLFTCLTIRAIHLEIAASLDTDSMIMALRRMMARRGKPQRIYSDNGTNFHGACEELRKAVLNLDKEEILKEAAMEKIDWHFIPPGSPHMGGCWERLIGSVKRALNVSLKERAPREEVLQTLFAEAEYAINNRPLTYVSDDPGDNRSLTPNDFLGLKPAAARQGRGPGMLTASDGEALRRQWRYSQWLANQFWRRWIKEYLPSINRRAKWHRERPEVKIGDLVVIWDENAPRNQWRRGRISAVHPGRDGRIRVADVNTSTGTLRRSVNRLCVLEIP